MLSRNPTRCPNCREKFAAEEKARGLRIHSDCIDEWLKKLTAKKQAARLKQERARAKVERAEFRRRKEAIKTIADLIEDAQREFNRFIRLRDADKPCFDCGKPYEPQRVGGSIDAGHLRSRGAATHLRFTETNVFGQRKNCNRPGGATEEAKKAGAAARIGWDEVNALYADNRVHKWTREELIAIRDKYRLKAKELEKERA